MRFGINCHQKSANKNFKISNENLIIRAQMFEIYAKKSDQMSLQMMHGNVMIYKEFTVQFVITCWR